MTTVLGSDRRLRRIAGAAQSDDLRWISGYVSIKEPFSPALWWHQDWWCWDHPRSYRRMAPQVAVLCYLTGAGSHNGGLRILPGSHVKSAPIHALLPEAHSHATGDLDARHPAMANLPGQITIAASAGDAVVIDYRLLHGTHANNTAARRDCVLLSFTPSWASLPEDMRSHLISHPALPNQEETPPARLKTLLPDFTGARRDLCLNRNAPAEFEIGV